MLCILFISKIYNKRRHIYIYIYIHTHIYIYAFLYIRTYIHKFPSPGNLPNPGSESRSPAFQADSLPAESPGKPKNTGVGSLSLLQRIFLTQESSQGLPNCRRILYQLSYQGSPYICVCVCILYKIHTLSKEPVVKHWSTNHCLSLSLLICKVGQ